jgi:hypothetical protein
MQTLCPCVWLHVRTKHTTLPAESHARCTHRQQHKDTRVQAACNTHSTHTRPGCRVNECACVHVRVHICPSTQGGLANWSAATYMLPERARPAPSKQACHARTRCMQHTCTRNCNSADASTTLVPNPLTAGRFGMHKHSRPPAHVPHLTPHFSPRPSVATCMRHAPRCLLPLEGQQPARLSPSTSTFACPDEPRKRHNPR